MESRNPNPELNEERMLFERAKEDPQAVGEIYDIYADRVYGFLLKRCGHKETAEDITSKTFIKFVNALPRLEWQGVTIGAWLFRTASNALIDHWRSASSRMDSELPVDLDLSAKEGTPESDAELTLESEKLLEVLKTLSPRDQRVLDLRFFAGFEPREIGEALGVSANHASVLVYRAIARLKKKYKETYA